MDRGKGKAVNNNRRNRLRKLNRFVNRLYRVVNDPAVDDLISWNQDGSSFIVLRPHDFAQHLLPKYYYHNDLSKFLARLHFYGFTRVVPDGWEFANVCFKRGEKKLLGSIQPQNCTKIEMESDACSVTCRAKDEEDCSDVDDSMATESQPGGVTTVRDMEETASTIPQDEGPYLEFLGKKFSCPASPSSSQNFGSPTQTSILRELSTTDQLSTNTNHHPSSRGYISPIVEHDFWSKEATTSNGTFNYLANFGSGLGGKDDKFSYSGSRCSDPNTRSPTPTTISGESSITCQVSTHTKHQPRFRVYIPPILQHDHEGSLLSKNKELDVVITEKATTSNATFSCLANFGLGLGGRDDTQTSVSERTVDPIALALDIGLRPNSNLNSNPNPPFRPPALLSQGQDVVVQESSLWGHSDGLIIGDALAYCSLYPPHHEFNRDTLVHLWIAAGFVLRDPMEDFATLFFEDCVSYGYFEFSRTDSVTRNPLYKFKRDSDLVGLLFRSRENDIFRIEGEFNQSDLSHVSHLSLACDTIKHTSIFLICKRFEQLRTLIFLGCKSRFKQIPHDFFQSLELLKVLDLSHSSLIELPTSIGNLKHLCFLDLSNTPINHLPEAIGNLKLLQTLKLRGCQSISALPKCMRKLVNLRHPDFDVLGQLDSMPLGMGALTNIRTLSAFLVSRDDECNIMQLKNMNNLCGSFCVSGLEYVLTKEDAEEACLSNKSHLKKLELYWSDSLDDVLSSQMVLCSLRPNTSLEDLRISCYDGSEFPSWISDPSFSKLASITLFECENCVALPSLGQLPSLKFLHIGEFHKLGVIDNNFYGDLGITSGTAFPNLEKLLVEDMSNLEVWEEIKNYYFPRLVKLTIKSCPKLHSLCSLSHLCSLEYLEIIHCPILDSCFNENLPDTIKSIIIEESPMIKARLLNDKGQDWLTVAHVAHVWIDDQEFPFGKRAQQTAASSLP